MKNDLTDAQCDNLIDALNGYEAWSVEFADATSRLVVACGGDPATDTDERNAAMESLNDFAAAGFPDWGSSSVEPAHCRAEMQINDLPPLPARAKRFLGSIPIFAGKPECVRGDDYDELYASAANYRQLLTGALSAADMYAANAEAAEALMLKQKEREDRLEAAARLGLEALQQKGLNDGPPLRAIGKEKQRQDAVKALRAALTSKGLRMSGCLADDFPHAPHRDANGLPTCSQDDCPAYDGKRCRLLGFRPDRFCEPALLAERQADSALRSAAGLAAGALAGAEFCKTDIRTDSAGNPVPMPHDSECRACRSAVALAALVKARVK